MATPADSGLLNMEVDMATRPKYQFRWCLPAGMHGGLVWANTTGEARAQIKKLLGLRSHDRLPKCITLKRDVLSPAA